MDKVLRFQPEAIHQWASTGYVDFMEIYNGEDGLSLAVARLGCVVAPGVDRRNTTYGRVWDLTSKADRGRVALLIKRVLKPLCIHVATPCTKWSIIGGRDPQPADYALAAFSLDILVHQDEQGLVAGHENPGTSALWTLWEKTLGSLEYPFHNWHWTAVNGCAYGLTSPGLGEEGLPMKKTYALVVNRPVTLHNRCREGLVSPMTRSTVLPADKVSPYMGLEEEKVDGHEVPEGPVPRPWRDAKEGVPTVAGFPVFFIRPGGTLESANQEAGEHLEEDSPVISDPKLEADAKVARARWMERARRGEWDQVHQPLSVYGDPSLKENPRGTKAYADKVVEAMGIRDPARRPHLSKEDRAAVEEVFRRKAKGMWLDGSPRTIIRGVTHDVKTVGGPVRGPPIRLKGGENQLVEDGIREDVARGQLIRGNSPWGSWAFPVAAHPAGKKRRIVVDYRRVNSLTIRAVYYLRTADSVKGECVGSIY